MCITLQYNLHQFEDSLDQVSEVTVFSDQVFFFILAITFWTVVFNVNNCYCSVAGWFPSR